MRNAQYTDAEIIIEQARRKRASRPGEGRPSSFRPEFCEEVRKLCLLGSIDQDLAEYFGVSMRTLNNWKHHHPEFNQAMREGKIIADIRVVHALYRSAIGYDIQSQKVSVDPETGEARLASFTKHYPPDAKACIFWLKNRRPEDWSGRPRRDVIPTAAHSIEVVIVGAVRRAITASAAP